MRIAADDNIPGARDAFGQFGDVVTFSGREVTREQLRDIDALVVRSVTRVNAALLDTTSVRFVGTATIGTDHLDIDYLRSRGIAFADAAGCNSRSVAEYVVASLLELQYRDVVAVDGATIGIIGMGRIGTLVATLARVLGMRVVAHDPPRARADSSFVSATLPEALDCDVVTVHVPLTVGCVDPTWHLIDMSALERMRPTAVLINTSRGAVVDNDDLRRALGRRLIAGAVLDVFEGEPVVPAELIARCAIATPHIAGYSLDGRARGTAMIADAVAAHLGTTNNWSSESFLETHAGDVVVPDGSRHDEAVRRAVRAAYDIMRDDAALRNTPQGFDALRKAYPARREFGAYAVITDDAKTRDTLHRLGFS